MHEFSLALNVVDLVSREVQKVHARKATSVTLGIGQCAGVEVDSLRFIWPEATRGSVLDEAKMKIHRIEGKARCMDCGKHFSLGKFHDPCPSCGSFLKEIYAGKDFKIESITVI